MNKVIHGDCMEYMKDCKDNQFDLAIVDPPYGIKRFSQKDGGNSASIKSFGDVGKNWNNNKPPKKYYIELFRVSKNQIIWGANNFTLPESEYFIVWDKEQVLDNFASCELAFVSMGLKKPSKIFRYGIHKLRNKTHPAEKPIALYKWLLQNYAKPGQTIFDSHVGSGSIRIACHDLGFDFTGCELDKDYFEAQEARYQSHIAQSELFGKEEIQGLVYNK